MGKSTLLRDHIALATHAQYVTFDNQDIRDRAQRKPTHFLKEFEKQKCILDEVQKAPNLFDAIKARVDEHRVPGQFILSGSTEFSQKVGIRESLTGRIGILRLFPLTFAETQSQPFSNSWVKNRPIVKNIDIVKIRKRVLQGGMPGICFLREVEERSASFAAWLDTTCYRDLQSIRGAKLSGELAQQILACLAKLALPTVANVAKILKQDARRIKSHIEALEALFVLVAVSPHYSGVGKTQYFIFDSGLAHDLGSSEINCYKIWVLNEILAQYEATGIKVKIYSYFSSHQSLVDFVIEDKVSTRGVIFTDEETVSPYVFRTAEAFLKKNTNAKIVILAPVNSAYQESSKISVQPFQAMT